MSNTSGLRLMSPSPATVIVKPLLDREIFFDNSSTCNILLSLWPTLRAATVDAVSSSHEDIAAFHENCLYFATILHKKQAPSPITSRIPSYPTTSLTRAAVEGPTQEGHKLDLQSNPWPFGTITRSEYLHSWREGSFPPSGQW